MAPEATTKTRKVQKNKSIQDEKDFSDGDRWEIVIFDNSHHYDYQVAELLVKVANLSEIQAFRAMRSAEKHGRARIGEYEFEMAEFYTSALIEHKLGCEMLPTGFQ